MPRAKNQRIVDAIRSEIARQQAIRDNLMVEVAKIDGMIAGLREGQHIYEVKAAEAAKKRKPKPKQPPFDASSG